MKNIKEFNKQNLKEVRSQIDSKLAELKELGLHISMGNISFDSQSFTSKITVQLVSDGETPKPQCQIDWEKGYHAVHGLELSDLFKEVTINGRKFKIVGCSKRSSKSAIKIEELSSGKRFNTSINAITDNLEYKPCH